MPVWYTTFVRGDSEAIHIKNNPWLFINLTVLNVQTPQFRSKFSFYVMSVETEGMLLLRFLVCLFFVSKWHWKCGSSVIFGRGTCPVIKPFLPCISKPSAETRNLFYLSVLLFR